MMNNQFYWLNIAEYLLIIITLITLVISTASGNLATPLLCLTLTVLLNLINRLVTEKRQRNKINLGLKKITQRVEQIEEIIPNKEIIMPHFPVEQSNSVEFITSYQEYLESLEKSLTNVVQYLNNSAFLSRIEYLERITTDLRTEINHLTPNKSANFDSKITEKVPVQEIPNKPLPSRQNWHCFNTIFAHSESVTSLALTLDGKFLASGSADNSLKIWSLKDGKLIDSIIAHEQALLSLAFTNSEKENYYLATGSYDQTINLWTLNKDKNQAIFLKNSHTLTNHTGSIHALAIAPQKNILISASYDQSIKQWDLTTGKLLCSSFDPLGAIYALALHQQREIIASAGADGSISLWQLGRGEMLGFLSGNVSSVQSLAMSRDGQILAAGCVDGNIRIWQLTADIFQSKIEPLPNHVIKAHSGQVTGLVFSNDSQNLFSSGADGRVKIWHLPTFYNVGILTINEHDDEHHNRVFAIALSADGELLSVGSIDGKITIWLRDN